jgi:DNA (cytosine-5)-methyltransferase 1
VTTYESTVSKGAYYNEIDPFAAAWLRELIKAGQIAPGEVDERDIREVDPDDLRGFSQCHFFAGIGGWSYALRRAGWDDSRPVWTGSCPCQPFSVAGAGKGVEDERHLWPAFFNLIRECRPGVVFGEQVAGADGIKWLDTVSADLEGEGYACGPVVLPACGVGAPNMRSRLWFVADTVPARRAERRAEPGDGQTAGCRGASELGNARSERSGGNARGISGAEGSSDSQGKENGRGPDEFGLASGGVGDTHRQGRQGRQGWQGELGDDGKERQAAERAGGAVGGFWANAEWLPCTDGRARPIEPGSFPLAYGIPARVGRLRGYGNAINAEAAAAVIRAYRSVKE